jgi:hypothetical protein
VGHRSKASTFRHFRNWGFEGENHPKVLNCEVLDFMKEECGPLDRGIVRTVDLTWENFRVSGIERSEVRSLSTS